MLPRFGADPWGQLGSGITDRGLLGAQRGDQLVEEQWDSDLEPDRGRLRRGSLSDLGPATLHQFFAVRIEKLMQHERPRCDVVYCQCRAESLMAMGSCRPRVERPVGRAT